jgi:hypothetical protein
MSAAHFPGAGRDPVCTAAIPAHQPL